MVTGQLVTGAGALCSGGTSSQRAGVVQNSRAERLAAARQCFLNTAASPSSVSAGGCHRLRLPLAVAMGLSP